MPRASGAVRAFYNSASWKNARAAYKSYRRYLCERCLQVGLIEPGTQVHHIVPLTDDNVSDPKISSGFNNLMLLCDKCHHEVHEERERSKNMKPGRRRWRLDENGSVIEPEQSPQGD